MVRLLKHNQLQLITWDRKSDDKIYEETDKKVPFDVRELANIMSQDRAPRVPRTSIVTLYITNSCRKIFDQEVKIKDQTGEERENNLKIIKKSVADAQLIIDDCLTAGFFDKDSSNNYYIILNLKGRKFATWFGLIKEWFIEDIGPMRAIITSIVVIIGAIKFGNILDFFVRIWPWK